MRADAGVAKIGGLRFANPPYAVSSVFARSEATKQSILMSVMPSYGLLRCARNDGEGAQGQRIVGWVSRTASAHSVQRAELVAVDITQIGEIKLARGTFPHTRWVFAGSSAVCDADRMPSISLLS